MANLSRIAEELHNDPLGVGYTAMSDEQVASSLNAQIRSKPENIRSVEVKRYMFAQGLWLSIKESTLDSAKQARDVLDAFNTFEVADPVVATSVEGFLDALKADGLIAEADKSAVQAMGVKPISRARETGMLTSERELTPFNIHKARLRM